MDKQHLSLLDLLYEEKDMQEPVYTSALNKSNKERDGFIAKTRDNIFGRKTKNKS